MTIRVSGVWCLLLVFALGMLVDSVIWFGTICYSAAQNNGAAARAADRELIERKQEIIARQQHQRRQEIP